MTSWYAERAPHTSAKGVIAVALLALLLVAALPVALLAAVVVMVLGHVAGGLALFGGSVLAAAIAVGFAGMSGMRHLRKLLSGSSFRVMQLAGSQYSGVAEPEGTDYPFRVMRLDGSQYSGVAEPEATDYPNVVQLDRSEYTEVR